MRTFADTVGAAGSDVKTDVKKKLGPFSYETVVYGLHWMCLTGCTLLYFEAGKTAAFAFAVGFITIDLVLQWTYFDKQEHRSLSFHGKLLGKLALLYVSLMILRAIPEAAGEWVVMEWVESIVFALILYRSFTVAITLGQLLRENDNWNDVK